MTLGFRLLPLALAFALVALASPQDPAKPATIAPKVAIVPWAMNGGTPTAVETAQKALLKLFEKEGYEVVNQAQVNSTWKRDMSMEIPDTLADEQTPPVAYPSAKDALALGKQLNVDMVCIGRLKWHTKSVWVSLGPKTKAEATVDCMLIDVAKGEIILSVKDAKSGSIKKESGLETAAAIFVSFGVTAFSGGPKTPHQQQAAVHAIAVAFDPWVKTLVNVNRKIGS